MNQHRKKTMEHETTYKQEATYNMAHNMQRNALEHETTYKQKQHRT